MANVIAASEGELRAPSLGELFWGILFGSLFISLSIPNVLAHWGASLGWSWLQLIGTGANQAIDSLAGVSPDQQFLSFEGLWITVLKALAVYLAALMLLSLRYLRFDLFFSGGLSLLLGTASLNIVAWVVYLLILIVRVILFVLGYILAVLIFIFSKIFAFFGYVLSEFFQFLMFLISKLYQFVVFLFSTPWWIIVILALVVALALAIRHRTEMRTVIVRILQVCGFVIAAYLLYKLVQLLTPFFSFLLSLVARFFGFLAALLAPIFRFLGMVFVFLIGLVIILVKVGLVGYVLYAIGAWVLDLFQGAWKSGNERRGVIIGALSIGTALALVLLESNLYQLAAFPYYPAAVATFIATYLHHTTPVFDLLMTLLIIGVCILGVLRNIPRLQKEPEWTEFRSAINMAIFGIIIGVILLVLSGGPDNN
ncbi:MAG TPA: hypothetical protein VFN78_06410 [Ktedonobacterales bacterium]|nr:hypothetical protein [Ktedonobacterales bacterium]